MPPPHLIGQRPSPRPRSNRNRPRTAKASTALVGHGVPTALSDDILDLARRFFALDDSAKNAISQFNSPHSRGYTRLGDELTDGAVDWREQIDIGTERPAVDGAVGYWNLQGPNQWPTEGGEGGAAGLQRIVGDRVRVAVDLLLPWLAGIIGLPDAVAGAWIGGNIDTTAAVAASGALAGENALQIATIVRTTQNALIGFDAIALTADFALRVERTAASARPSVRDFWERFPKFVLGFVAASVIGTVWVANVAGGKADIATINELRTWFLIFAFVSIGLEFSASGLREAGWRPIAVFGSATVVNIVVALGLAVVLFGNFQV